MWKCSKCGERIEDQFDSCWKCSTPKGASPVAPTDAAPEAPKWTVAYRVFRGTFISWEGLFDEATAFANELGSEKIINISHSEDQSDGVVVVWYYTNENQK